MSSRIAAIRKNFKISFFMIEYICWCVCLSFIIKHMGRHKVLIFTFTSYDWQGYKDTLELLFKDTETEFVYSSVKDWKGYINDIDLVLSSAKECSLYISSVIGKDIPVIWMNHTLLKSDFAKIKRMTEEGKVSIVADTLYYAEQRRRMLVSLGLPENCFELWVPSMDEYSLKNKIIRYEDAHIPSVHDYEVVSIIGRGLLAPDTLLQTALFLNCPEVVETEVFIKYIASVCPYFTRVTDMTDIGRYYAISKGFGTRTGCLLFLDNRLYYCDEDAEVILMRKSLDVIGMDPHELFPDLRLIGDEEKIINFDSRKIVIKVWVSETHKERHGYILLSSYSEELRKELSLRKVANPRPQKAKYTFSSIQGESKAIQDSIALAKKMADSSANVLITGPSGSGKELFAQAIHNGSSRKDKPFVSINCGALVEDLLESELFGYVAGAFTGASKEGKVGLFELAHQGTLFLDEIGELPLRLQVKLLRVLQEREVVRVGGTDIIPIDVRIISATNRDLKALVKEGKFRLDLFYRLDVLPLELPSLNERRDDILPLFTSMMMEHCSYFTLTPAAKYQIENHHYQGNVRELQNAVEYLSSLKLAAIDVSDLPPYMREDDEEIDHSSSSNIDDTDELVMHAIREICSMGISAGRRSIRSYLLSHGKNISEFRIRRSLSELERKGFIEIHSGRAGIEIPK